MDMYWVNRAAGLQSDDSVDLFIVKLIFNQRPLIRFLVPDYQRLT